MQPISYVPPRRSRRGVTAAYLADMFGHLSTDSERTDVLAPLWPLLVELVEANCQPGFDAHPVVVELHERFVARTLDAAALDVGRYVAWLIGQCPDLSEDEHATHLARWKRRQGL